MVRPAEALTAVSSLSDRKRLNRRSQSANTVCTMRPASAASSGAMTVRSVPIDVSCHRIRPGGRLSSRATGLHHGVPAARAEVRLAERPHPRVEEGVRRTDRGDIRHTRARAPAALDGRGCRSHRMGGHQSAKDPDTDHCQGDCDTLQRPHRSVRIMDDRCGTGGGRSRWATGCARDCGRSGRAAGALPTAAGRGWRPTPCGPGRRSADPIAAGIRRARVRSMTACCGSFLRRSLEPRGYFAIAPR